MRVDSVRGHLDAMLLGVLEAGPLHGYGIMEAIERRSRGVVALPTGTVYPALHRLERAGLLVSHEDLVSGRVRRVYALTRAGRTQLHSERREWREFTATVSAVLGEATA